MPFSRSRTRRQTRHRTSSNGRSGNFHHAQKPASVISDQSISDQDVARSPSPIAEPSRSRSQQTSHSAHNRTASSRTLAARHPKAANPKMRSNAIASRL